MLRWLPFLLVFAALPAHATWLVTLPDDVTRVDAAARDVPVTQYDYDGHAHASLGGTLELWHTDDRPWLVRWQVFALGAVDNAGSQLPWPDELGRFQAGTRFKFTSPAVGQTLWHLDVGLRHDVAVAIGTAVNLNFSGKNGIFPSRSAYTIDLGAGFSRPIGALHLEARVGNRIHVAAIPKWLHQLEIGDVLADSLGGGIAHNWQADVNVTWAWRPSWQPMLALHGDVVVPVDDFNTPRYTFRALLGIVRHVTRGALLPFASLDVGAGPGLLLNRQEVRLGLGVRYVP